METSRHDADFDAQGRTLTVTEPQSATTLSIPLTVQQRARLARQLIDGTGYTLSASDDVWDRAPAALPLGPLADTTDAAFVSDADLSAAYTLMTGWPVRRYLIGTLVGIYGLRPRDITGMHPDDLHGSPGNLQLRLYHDDTRTVARIIRLARPVATAMQLWTARRAELLAEIGCDPGDAPLFHRVNPTRTEPLMPEVVERIIGDLGRQAEMGDELTSYQLYMATRRAIIVHRLSERDLDYSDVAVALANLV